MINVTQEAPRLPSPPVLATSSLSEAGQACLSTLPSSLQKLLNPILPPSPPASPVDSQSTESISSRSCTMPFRDRPRLMTSDLTQFRPWKRLPPPKPTHALPQRPQAPTYFCFPAPHTHVHVHGRPPCQLPHLDSAFNTYEVPVPQVSEEPFTRLKDWKPSKPNGELISRRGRSPQTGQPSCVHVTSHSFMNHWTRPDFKTLEVRTSAGTGTGCDTSQPHTCSRECGQPGPMKRSNGAKDKGRNRCLTCGSSFSTFANLTRHEKKCSMVPAKLTF